MTHFIYVLYNYKYIIQYLFLNLQCVIYIKSLRAGNVRKQYFRWHRILALRIYNVKKGDFCKLKFESVPQ